MRSLLAGQERVLRRERMLWTGRDRREFRGRYRGLRVRGAGYAGLPCSPRAPGCVRGQRRGEARRADGEGRLSFLELLRLLFDDQLLSERCFAWGSLGK